MMEKDNTLEELFRNFEPQLNDDDKFMREFNHRLQAVEYLKRVQDRQLHRYKLMAMVAFVIGIMCGGVHFHFVMQNADTIASLPLDTTVPMLAFLVENGTLILLSLIVLMICYALVRIMNIAQELMLNKESAAKDRVS